MPSYNRVILMGNLTRNPETKFLPSGQAVANFGLAVNEKYKGKDGEMKESVVFVDVESWGKLAELVGKYLEKGRPCLIEGRLKLDTWEKDGQKQSKLKVVADSVQFLGSKGDGDAKPAASAAPTADDTEVPF
jgi:single-strand DNA-binding protein